MSKKKANIRPELIGELFTDGKEYFELISCETEPHATFSNVAWQSPTGQVIIKPISQFANMIHLTPDRKIEVKPERKPRSDKGKNHKQASDVPTIVLSEGLGNPVIKTSEGVTTEPDKGNSLVSEVTVKLAQDGGEHTVIVRGSEGKGKTLKEATANALKPLGGGAIDTFSDYDKKLLEGMLNPGKGDVR